MGGDALKSSGKPCGRPRGAVKSRIRAASAAFTLVELLVVIGIISVLIAILLPSLNKARQSANSLACLSNERQIGLALAMYAQDNRDKLPLGAFSLKDPSIVPNPMPGNDIRDLAEWGRGPVGLGFLAHYVGYKGSVGGSDLTGNNRPRVFRCPANANWGGTRDTEYFWRGWLSNANWTDYAYWRDSEPGDPAYHFGKKRSQLHRRVLVFCGSAGYRFALPNGGHMGGSNFLFDDGHAEHLMPKVYNPTGAFQWWQYDQDWKR